MRNLCEAAEVVCKEAEDVCKGGEQGCADILAGVLSGVPSAQSKVCCFMALVALRFDPSLRMLAPGVVREQYGSVGEGGGGVQMEVHCSRLPPDGRCPGLLDPEQGLSRDGLFCIANQYEETRALCVWIGEASDEGVEPV